jgi:peptide/nickel transport system permease protein
VIRTVVGIASLVILICILVACSFPGLFWPHDPNEIDFAVKFVTPGRDHPMGTDEMGRDLLARVLHGGRVTIWSSLVVAAGSVLIATFWAAVSAYAGGMVDELMTRVVDALMNIPSLLFVLILVSIMEPGMKSLVLALTLIRWTGYARIIRGQIFSLMSAEFLVAARALGATSFHVIRRHVIPNTFFLVVTLFGLSFGSNMLSISSLSFLGFGVQLPHAEWGAMIKYARPFLQIRPYLLFFPGLAMVVTILVTNVGVRFLEQRGKQERARWH